MVGATDSQDDVRHFGLDHLGTIRIISSGVTGEFLARHTYFPFGQEASATDQDAEVMKFAGHERDLLSTPTRPEDDLDSMHARFFSPVLGRFMGTDPEVPTERAMASPQTWNKYAYVLGNPLGLVDPDGKAAVIVVSASDTKEVTGAHGKHTLYGATIVRFTVAVVNGSPTIKITSVTKVFVGLTAEHSKVASRNSGLRTSGDPTAVRGGDVPAGTFDVTKSNGAKGSARGWFMYNTPGEGPGIVTVGNLKRDGMSIHPGLPCNSEGCMTTPDWKTFRGEIQPELDAKQPVQITIPDLYGGSPNVP